METLPPHVLCTGGLGYIGSHTVLKLLANGFRVSILDNLSNSSDKVIERLWQLSSKQVTLIRGDLRDKRVVSHIFQKEPFDAVVHFAGLKSVGESVAHPLKYYDTNVTGTLNLLEIMSLSGCRCLVFSSSATVYAPSESPIDEMHPLQPCNPYGQTKLMVEQILKDLHAADPSWRISILRYFNPVGADPSGCIGESPEIATNLLPTLQHVAIGKRPILQIFGDDWDTPDGTGVRDYLHVEDLASGHLAALKKLQTPECLSGAFLLHNLGTGRGYSVLELKKHFENASGKTIPFEIVPRRTGDLGFVVANPLKAEKDLNWKATHTIEEACSSAWKWQSENPNGYEEPKQN